MNCRIWSFLTAFSIRLYARSNEALSTLVGSSPFACITSVIESAISVRNVTLPFSFGSSSSWSTDLIGVFVSFRFEAMPVIPDCQGRL